MEGGTVYILQEFVFHIHCFCCPLHDLFFGFGRGDILLYLKGLQTNLFYLSFTQSFGLTRGLKQRICRAIPRTASHGNCVILSFSIVTFAACDSSFQLQDMVLAVSDLQQRVIARDQSDRSPVWPYQSRCYICLLSIGNNFKYQI